MAVHGLVYGAVALGDRFVRGMMDARGHIAHQRWVEKDLVQKVWCT